MIEVQNLGKSFGELVAVEDVSFVARSGEIFGLLGPNGAGKSTTISCICGLVAPSSGQISVLGHDVVREGTVARRELGVVPQELALYEDLSATENLRYWGAAYGLRSVALRQRVLEVLELIGLVDRAAEPVSRFSGGMKRRLNFGCAIVHQPRVLLLDEPTVGVDPQSRVHLLELVQRQVELGTCVLYTTHYMEEAEALCDRLAIMDHGRLIASGNLAELRGLLAENDVLRLTGEFEPAATTQRLAAIDGVEVVHADAGSLRLAVANASRKLPALFDAIAAAGGAVRETTVTQPNLESLFIKLTGKELRE